MVSIWIELELSSDRTAPVRALIFGRTVGMSRKWKSKGVDGMPSSSQQQRAIVRPMARAAVHNVAARCQLIE